MMQPPQILPVAPPVLADESWHVVRAAERGLHWHPQVRDLLFHWLRLCGTDSRLPAPAAFDHALLGELLPYIWLLDVRRAPWRFRYRMAGAAFIDSVGIDVTDHRRLITTVRDGVPTWRRGRVPQEDRDAETGGWSAIENLMLPLGIDGIAVDTVLGISMPYRPIDLWDAPDQG